MKVRKTPLAGDRRINIEKFNSGHFLRSRVYEPHSISYVSVDICEMADL